MGQPIEISRMEFSAAELRAGTVGAQVRVCPDINTF